MFIYNGCACPVCSEIFDTTSDIVVCPECGTPSHRHCWTALGHCANELKHPDGFVWQSPVRAVTQGMDACLKCHAENPKDATFCESCGTAINQKQSSIIPSFTDFKAKQAAPTPIAPVISALPKSLEGEQGGVSLKDMSIYIGPSAPYYIFKFKRIEKEGKGYKPFCWSAFLFGPIYFLYRKMWLLGVLCGLGNLIINTPTAIIYAVQTGVLPAASPLMFAGIETLASILTPILFATNIIWGFLAIPFFQKKVITDLRQIKAVSVSNDDYYQTIVKRSGPSKLVLLGSLVFALYYMII